MVSERMGLFILEPYMGAYGQFVGLIVLAFIVGLTPLRYPFQWMETYYHELSHGIAALMTRGRIGRIKLNWDGSGWCSTRGGSRFFILIMGYVGASLWGGYLYIAGFMAGAHDTELFLQIELGILLFTTLFFVRDLITLCIVGTMAATFLGAMYFPYVDAIPLLIQFMGIYVVLNAIRAPLHLIDGQHVGDGAALADLTYIFPEGVWIVFWLLFAIATLGVLMYLTLPGADLLFLRIFHSVPFL